MTQDNPSPGGDSAADSVYMDAILEYETRLDRKESVDPEEIIGRYRTAEPQLREFFKQRLQATHLFGTATGRRVPDFIDIQSFGFYSVLELMDWGGNASIHKVEDVRFGRTAALKIPLKKWADDPQALRRLQREARLSGRLQHPNIVPIYDVGTTFTPSGELPYFTMRLVNGRQLSELLKDRPDTSADHFKFILLFRQVCQAVAYAHDQGILHRDLKPNNVMIGDFDDAYVMDWGYAKDLQDGSAAPVSAAARPIEEFVQDLQGSSDDLAKTVLRHCPSDSLLADDELILGTPCYLPPEIAQRGAGAADRTSDVFCLGGILCAILTGEPTYRSTELMELSRMAYSGDVSDALARLNASGAAPELIALAQDCLAPKPQSRPADAHEVAHRVSDYIHRQEQAKLEAERRTAREAQARAEAESQNRRNAEAKFVAERHSRRLTVILAGALLAFVGSATGVLWHSVETARIARHAETKREVARCLDLADSIREKVERQEPSSLADIDQAIVQWNRYLGTLDQATSAATASELPKGDGLRIASARDHGHARLTELHTWQQFLADLEASAELTTLAIDEYAPSQVIVDQAFHAAFQRFGIARPDDLTAVAAAIRPLPGGLRDRVAEAIDRWALSVQSISEERFNLATSLQQSPPAWRNAISHLHASKDVDALRQLILNAESEPATLSPSFYMVATQAVRQWTTVNEAILLNKRARDRFRDDYPLHLQAGALQCDVDVARLDRAEDAFRAALAVSPQSPTALAALGYVLRMKGEFPQAVQMLETSLKQQPSFPWALTNLAIIRLTIEGDARAAESLFRQALETFPKYPIAADGLALTYAMIGQSNRALNIHESLGIDPKTSTLRGYGDVSKHLAAGQLAAASDDLEKLARHPLMQSRREIFQSLIAMLRGELDVAESMSLRVQNGKPDRFDKLLAGSMLGLVHLLDGRPELAEADFAALSIEAPEFLLATGGLALAELHSGQVNEAREKLANMQNSEILHSSVLNGVASISLKMYMSLVDLFLGPADRIMTEPTVEGALKGVMQDGGFYQLPVAELAVMRKRAYLAYTIYVAMISEFPGSMLAGSNAVVNFWRHPTHRMNGVRAIGLLLAGKAADQSEVDPSEFPRMQQLGQRWLRSELKSWSRIAAKRNAAKRNGHVRTKIWLHFCRKCPDLAGVRDGEFLEKMSPEDRDGWRQIWTEMDELQNRLQIQPDVRETDTAIPELPDVKSDGKISVDH